MYSVVLLMALSGGAEATEFGKRCNGCSGCSGYVGCSGCSGYVGCSGCSGCHGGRKHKHSRCSGCSGCSGYYGCSGCSGCHGRKHSRCHGCSGCYGSVYYGCSGSVGCSGCSGAVHHHTAVETTNDSVARIVITVPANARLTVDGTETKSTSERRVFVTPALEQGEYAYTLQAQIDRDGQTVTETRLVTVRPGQTSTATFEFATQNGVASR